MDGINAPSIPKRRTEVQCPCGQIHKLSPTAIVACLHAFMAGDATRFMGKEIVPMCLIDLLDNMPESGLEAVRTWRIEYER